MSEAYRRLVEHLPPRAAATRDANADPRALRAILDALPMANFGVALRKLLEALQALNGHAFDGAQRLDGLEVLREPAMQLLTSADRQIVGASFPLPRQKAELGELALQFRGEFATGYRIALAELCKPNGSVPFMRGRQVALAAVRALQHGSDWLAGAYQIYRTPPLGAWRALHDVYRFAVSLRLDDRAIDETDARGVYAQALLLALANPYRHTQREQVELVALVRVVAPLARLHVGNHGGHDVPIDADADAGPGYLPDERLAGAAARLALDIGPALELVDRQLASMQAAAISVPLPQRGGTALQVDAALLRKVATAWGARATRGHERLGGGYMLDSVLGLHDLHYVLAGGEGFDAFMQRVRGQAISLSEADRASSWRTGASEFARATRLPVRVVDQGLGGYRLLWDRGDGGAAARARVSELVGLALPDPGDGDVEWMIGVIRWIRIDDQGRVDAGVELLARRALPVGVRSLDHMQARVPLRGLLLTPLAAEDGADYAALVTATELDRLTTEVDLAVPTDLRGPPLPARSARALGLRVVEATGTFQHFALPDAPPHAEFQAAS